MSVVLDGGLGLGRLHHGDLDAEQSLALDLLVLSLGMAADRLHPVQLAEHLGLLEHVHHVRKLIPHEPLARLLVPADAAQQLHVCSLGVASTHHEQCNAASSLVSTVVDASGESGIGK